MVKHAGLAPREKKSGAFTGRARLTGAGRPGLRLAAWRGVWGTQRANPVYAARYRHLTTRETNPLTATQARQTQRPLCQRDGADEQGLRTRSLIRSYILRVDLDLL
ncbi:transposase [Nocardia sp. NBC_01499]|uniref:transposase n=1 Tax=Nocardia sp. NBC_01499 TaxID=2903597 RepID=UPI003866CB9B